jgi:hypothetical protein
MGTNNKGGVRKWIANRIYHEAAQPAPIGTPKPKELKISINSIKDVVKQSVGVYQTPSFDSLIRAFLADQVLKDGIYDFSDEVVSSDIFITIDKKYDFTVDGKTAHDVLDKWIADNHIYDLCRNASAEIAAFGNSFARFSNTGGGLSRIPLEAAWHMIPTSTELMSAPIQEKYKLQLTPIYSAEILDDDSLIHFRLNAIGLKEPFGVGLMQGITARPVLSDGSTLPSIYDVRLSKRQVLSVGMLKWATGNIWIFMKDLPEEQLDSLSSMVQKMAPTGNRVLVNYEGKIDNELNERSEGWDKFAEQMDAEFLACVAPYHKLGLGVIQKSSAAQMGKVYDRRLQAIRNVLKGAFRDIFIAVLKSAGFKDPELAHADLGFAEEESPPPTIGDLNLLVNSGIITPNECRQLLRENQHLEVQGDIEGGDKPVKPQAGKQPTNPETRDITTEKAE